MLLFDSLKKSKVMKTIEKLMTTEFQGFQDMMTRRSKEEALFSELFFVMKKIDGLR